MKRIILVALMTIVNTTFAQTIYMTRNGQVSFFSKTPMENIDATNDEVTSIINSETGEIVFAVLVKSFRFEKALMEEHFNENYMESTQYPKSTFQGKITNLSSIDFKKDAAYAVNVEGDLTLHGIKRHIQSTGTMTLAQGKVSAVSSFVVSLSDYEIEIPSLVAGKIAKTIEIKVTCQYEPKSK